MEEKIEKFTFFDWVILIGGILILLIMVPTFLLFLGGLFPEKVGFDVIFYPPVLKQISIKLLWIAIGCLAVRSKYRKFKTIKLNRQSKIEGQ